MSACVNHVCLCDYFTKWMSNIRLKCNGSKAEVMVLPSLHMTRMIDCTSFAIGDVDAQPAVSIRNLGAIFNQRFTFTDHIASCVNSANFHIRNIGWIRKYLTTDATKMYVHALVTSRLDFSNALLYGLPKSSLARLQKVQDSAAILVFRTRKFSSITPVLCDLHWLPVEQRITFKILLLTFKALNGLIDPSYLSELISPRSQTRTLSFWYQPIFCRDRTADFPHGQSKKVLVGSNCVVKSNCWQ